ncbi:MAG: hypothetical protein OEM00_00545 [Burkholderiaceae bacterium]|nr:hypothetical protein [Burkholderiaceae bacterium]MDH3459473.1 hypothetical protein [Burkholderiaceae bacterium]
MAERYRVALLGFGRFECDALSFSINLADSGERWYELADTVADSDFIVADADKELVNGQVASSGRLSDTLFVGSKSPPGAAAYVARPINPQSILRALDDLITRQRAAVPASVDTALPESTDGADTPLPNTTAEATPHSAPVIEASDAATQSLDADNANEEKDEEDATPLTFRRELTAEPVPETAPDEPATSDFSPTQDGSTNRAEAAWIDENLTERPAPVAALGDAAPANSPIATAKPSTDRESKRAATKAAVRRAVRRAQLAQSERSGAARPVIFDTLVLEVDPTPSQLCALLEVFGFRVHHASTSERAIAVMRAIPLAAVCIDLVLADSDDTDGLDLCLRIKQKQLGVVGDAPVVVLVSGQATATARVQAKLAGCDAFLIEPVTRGDLVRALESCGVALPTDPRCS